MRVILAAVALTALSFVAGVAGDLTKPANAGASVTLRIPPPIPADAPRAAPLPPLVSAAAAAAELPRRAEKTSEIQAQEPEPAAEAAQARYPKQRRDRVLRRGEAKQDARLAAKQEPKKGN